MEQEQLIQKELIEEFLSKNKESESEGEYYNSNEEYLIDCCRGNCLEEIKELLEQEQDVDILYVDNNLNNIFHMSSANGNIEVLKLIWSYLKDKKQEEKMKKLVNHQNSDGNTPMHWAVINNQISIVEFLLEQKADCNLYNKQGNNPLTEAITLQRTKCSELIAPHVKVDLSQYNDLPNYQVFDSVIEDVTQEEDEEKDIIKIL